MTSMEFGYERIGYECAKLLQHLMEGGEAPAKPLLSPSGLVIRESTDFHAVQDELVAAALTTFRGTATVTLANMMSPVQ